MKYMLIVYCMSFALVCAASSDSPKKTSRRRSSKNIVTPLGSPGASPKDRSRLMYELSVQSKKTVNVREQNPYVLPISASLPRSKSNPENLGGLMLLDEVAEALREVPVTPVRARKGSLLSKQASSISIDLQEVQSSSSEDALSPRRDVPVSPGRMLSPRALVRVASLNTCGKAIDAVDGREKRKQEYRKQLGPVEQRIFDVVGLKNLEFIKKQPHVLQVLGDLPKDDIESWYMAYLRSTILILQEKLTNVSPRNDSADAVIKLIQAEQQDDLSPRKDGVSNSSDGVRARIKEHLATARKDSARLIGAPIPIDEISGSCPVGRSMSLPSTSNS